MAYFQLSLCCKNNNYSVAHVGKLVHVNVNSLICDVDLLVSFGVMLGNVSMSDGLHCVCNSATFADSDGCLSDGGEFYNIASKRPSALLTTIPIVKTDKVNNCFDYR